MSNVIISIESNSMIYHKSGCRYADRIRNRNKLFLSEHEARKRGYRLCKCCNSMNHHMKKEWQCLDYYSKGKGLQYNFIDGILYVKTQIGLWKLVYSRKMEKIVLFHRNASSKPIDFENPQYENYHRQADKPCAANIGSCLYYLYEHDIYKETVEKGEKVTRFTSKKYEKIESRQKRKRERKRVDYLFRMLETQNEGYRELSIR